METVSLDIAPQQVVRWLQDERRAGRLPVAIRATRSFLVQQPEVRVDDLGGDSSEPLDEITAVGTLEVKPLSTRDGWSLKLRVEDDAGARLPDDEPVPEDEEEIDLDTFAAEFMARDRGTAFISVDVEDDAALKRFEALANSVLGDVHPK
jgi:hypothetical protein